MIPQYASVGVKDKENFEHALLAGAVHEKQEFQKADHGSKVIRV